MNNASKAYTIIVKICCCSCDMSIMAGRSRATLTAEDVVDLLDDPDEPVMPGSDDEDILWEDDCRFLQYMYVFKINVNALFILFYYYR